MDSVSNHSWTGVNLNHSDNPYTNFVLVSFEHWSIKGIKGYIQNKFQLRKITL